MNWNNIDSLELYQAGTYVFIDADDRINPIICKYNFSMEYGAFYEISNPDYTDKYNVDGIKQLYTHWMLLPPAPETKRKVFERFNQDVGSVLQKYYDAGELNSEEIAKYMKKKADIAKFLSDERIQSRNYLANVIVKTD